MYFFEMICFSKVLCAAMGLINRNTITKQEADIACEVLKKIADNRNDWVPEQKELYKVAVDIVKELGKQYAGEKYGG